MGRSRTPLLLAAALSALCVSVIAARQAPAPQTSPTVTPAPKLPTTSLAGTWSFDEKSTYEDQRNWRRPVAADTRVPTAGVPSPSGGSSTYGAGSPGPGLPLGYGGSRSAAGLFDNDVRRAIRDLLEPAPMFVIDVGNDTVTLSDDLQRATTFSTDGRREKHRSGATEYESKTFWNEDNQLVQELSRGKDLKVSLVWLPANEGKALFLWIKIEKPVFTPPIKDIKRVYLKAR
jgi:hypothetical protein